MKKFSLAAAVGAVVFIFGSLTRAADTGFPIYFDNAYVHLPDFSKRETLEILAYSALFAVVKNYAEGRIGFVGPNKVFKFGGPSLTKGVEYLFNTCKDCIVYDGLTIRQTLDLIKQDKLDFAKFNKGIKEEVAKRQAQIGYWDYVPIP